jgi:glycosyltransferase involved in cell wall biosynthesis
MSLVESLLCGTPVVCSDVGNVRELIRHKQNGFIANSEDINDFCNGIEWLLSLSDSQISKTRYLCRSCSSKYHDIDTILSRLTATYNFAIDGGVTT